MNAIAVFTFSSLGLFCLAFFHFIFWRFARPIKKLKSKAFKKLPVLPMPIEGTQDAAPGIVYAKIKQEFKMGNEQGCELPLIYLISLKLQKEFTDIEELLARCYLAKNQIKKAEIILRNSIEAGNFLMSSYVLLSDILVKQRRHKEAYEFLLHASNDIVNPHEIWEPLYELAKKLGENEVAERADAEFKKSHPES